MGVRIIGRSVPHCIHAEILGRCIADRKNLLHTFSPCSTSFPPLLGAADLREGMPHADRMSSSDDTMHAHLPLLQTHLTEMTTRELSLKDATTLPLKRTLTKEDGRFVVRTDMMSGNGNVTIGSENIMIERSQTGKPTLRIEKEF